MTPFTVVHHLAVLVRVWDDFTEDAVHARLLEAGIPALSADQAFKFTQIAWGRAFLKDLRLTFDPGYVCLDMAGRTTETGLLAEQPYFRAAVDLASSEQQYPGFLRLAMMSAEVRVVNELLNTGSRVTDLVTGPHTLIFEDPPIRKTPWWPFR